MNVTGTITFNVDPSEKKSGCQKCGRLLPTVTYAEGGVVAAIHGLSVQWCSPCVVREQLDFARARAGEIPMLEKRLEEVDAEASKIEQRQEQST